MQRNRPFDIIRRLRLDSLTLEWAPSESGRPNRNGYYLSIGSRPDFGFVRYNVLNTQGNAYRFAIYARAPFDDPRGRFENQHTNPNRFGWRCIVDPDDERDIAYVVGVLQSAARNTDLL